MSGFVHAGNINLTGGMTAQGNINTIGNITANDITASNDLRVVGDLDHEGSNVGFFGKTPAIQYADALNKVWNTVNSLPQNLGSIESGLRTVAFVVDQLVDIVKRYGLAAA